MLGGCGQRVLGRATVSALALAVTSCASAAARSPVRVAPWHVTDDFGLSVDGKGRGVVVFPHGDHVWMASVTPDGRLRWVGRIPSPYTGPENLVAVQDEAGDVLAGNSEYTGTAESGLGSGRQPWVTRLSWGQAPPRSAPFSEAEDDAQYVRAGMRADGEVAMAWNQQALEGAGQSRIAILPKGGVAVTTEVAGLADAVPDEVQPSGGGFVVGWARRDDSLAITHVAPDGSIGPPQRVPGSAKSSQPRILADERGDIAVVWQDVDGGHRRSVRLATRNAGGARFRTQTLARGQNEFVDAAIGADGTIAVLVRRARAPKAGGSRMRVIRRRPGGAPASATTLVGRAALPPDLENSLTYSHVHQITVDAHGVTTVAYAVQRGRMDVTRAVRISRAGRLRGLATVAGCTPLGLAGAASGRGLLAMLCPRPEAKLYDEQQGGSVLTLPPS